MKLARGGKSFILGCLIPGVILLVLSLFFLNYNYGYVLLLFGVSFLILASFFLMFFRDPDRKTGKNIVACADGKIRDIWELNDEDVGKCICVSTFMNVYNVHVNRMPFDGIIKNLEHKSGFHLPAFTKESDKNERTIILVDSKIGLFKIVQIAGTLARRIVPYIKNGDAVKKGERIGIIRLGSRVDIYLPKDMVKKVSVKVGGKIKAGVDTVAEINA